MTYQSAFNYASSDSAQFWLEQAQKIKWFKSPQKSVTQNSDGLYQWFEDGELNTSYLALDHQIEMGRGSQTALIYDSPVTNSKQMFTYEELLLQVSLFAGSLKEMGVNRGDRVLIYMPMIPQAVISMLACARIGAVHSVVFGGFAANELAVRIDDAQPKVVVTASCGIEIDKVLPYKPIVDNALELADHNIEHCVIYQRKESNSKLLAPRDLDWDELIVKASPVAAVTLRSNEPLYILYTSGTTGKPKGVVRDNGGHAVAMRYSMEAVYGVEAGDVFWAASDVGWVVGHSYIVYAPLLSGCTTVLYEGKPVRTPDSGAFWRVCEEHRVNVLFSAPTAFRAIRKEDPTAQLFKQYDLSCLKRLYLAGERLDPSTYNWLRDSTGLPVIDHWWQTETGWAIAGIPYGIEKMNAKEGSAGVVIPGYQVEVLDAKGEQTERGESGNVAIKLPMPPGCLSNIWGSTDRLKSGYLSVYDGYYVTGDGGYIDRDGYLYIMGRTDDVINVAGHRLSTGEMEEVIAGHSAIAECAVVGVKCSLKGQVPLALVVAKNGEGLLENVGNEIKLMIRSQIGAIASLRDVLLVERLPKTRSGKILRKVMRQMVDGDELQVPSTIDDKSILDELALLFKHRLA